MNNKKQKASHRNSANGSIVSSIFAVLFMVALGIIILPTLITSALLSSFWFELRDKVKGTKHKVTIGDVLDPCIEAK